VSTETLPSAGSAGKPVRIWIDAQLPPSLASWLRSEHGVAADHVSELDLAAARDAEIFAAAKAVGDGSVIITKDDDFRTLLTRSGPPPRVIWVRCGNVTNSELRRIISDAWPRAEALLRDGESLIEIRRRGERSS
jgi:predicted nuclease of predicted toxin-antitoxin system